MILTDWVWQALARRQMLRGRGHQLLLQAFGQAFSDANATAIESLGKSHVRSTICRAFEIRRLQRLRGNALIQHCRGVVLKERDLLSAQLSQSAPIIIATAHYGTYITGLLKLILEISPHRPFAVVMSDPQVNESVGALHELVGRLEGRAQIAYTNRTGLRIACSVMERGGVIAMAVDEWTAEMDTCFVPFLGHLFAVATGCSQLAERYGASILPVRCTQFRDGLSELRLEAPITPPVNAHDLRWATTASVLATVERWIRDQPEEWILWKAFPKRIVPGLKIPKESADWLTQLRQFRSSISDVAPETARILGVLTG